VFEEACLGGDLDTADLLLAVMQDKQQRQAATHRDRRPSDGELERAREALAARKAGRAEPRKEKARLRGRAGSWVEVRKADTSA